jgi:hypothetical protein
MTPKAQLLLQGRIAETFPDAVVGPPIVVEWASANGNVR